MVQINTVVKFKKYMLTKKKKSQGEHLLNFLPSLPLISIKLNKHLLSKSYTSIWELYNFLKCC